MLHLVERLCRCFSLSFHFGVFVNIGISVLRLAAGPFCGCQAVGPCCAPEGGILVSADFLPAQRRIFVSRPMLFKCVSCTCRVRSGGNARQTR